MIHVLLGDASPRAGSTRQTLEVHADIVVLEVCHQGQALVDRAIALQPDVVVTEVDLDGPQTVAAIRRLMTVNPLPLLLFGSTVTTHDHVLVREGLAAGATDVLLGGQQSLPRLTESVRRLARERSNLLYGPRRSSGAPESPRSRTQPDVVVVGASTGGPPAVSAVLRALPAGFDLPVILGQHIGSGFVQSLAATLGAAARRRVHVVAGREPIQPGTLYLAADGCQLHVSEVGWLEAKPLPKPEPTDGITQLFESAARAYGDRVTGVLLTGMGRDGAVGLLAIREKGGYTVVQSPPTCAVDGMPRAAIDLGAAQEVLTLEEIGLALGRLSSG